jgi:hypothetical protein
MGRAVRFGAVVLFLFTGNAPAQVDLTGTWYNAESTVWVRQVGTDVWWVCQSTGDGGKSWTAAFHGKLNGNKLTGHFADVPKGENRMQGSLSGDLVIRGGKVASIEVEAIFSPSRERQTFRLTHTKPK